MSQVSKNPPNNPVGFPPPAQGLNLESIENKPTQEKPTTDKAKDLSRADNTVTTTPPQTTEVTNLVNKLRKLTKLGITDILVPLTRELFKRYSQIALESPQISPEEKGKIGLAQYLRTDYITQAATSLVVNEVIERIKKFSGQYRELRPHADSLAIKFAVLIDKHKGFNEEAIKDLYETGGELFYQAFNDPKTLSQSISLLVQAVDSLMDESRGYMDDPRPKMQEVLKKILEMADGAITAEKFGRVTQEHANKYSVLGIKPLAIG